MGLTGMVFGTITITIAIAIAIAAGAVMYWAVTAQGHGCRLSTVGVILMIVGGIGLVVSTVIFGTSRRPSGSRHHTYDGRDRRPGGVHGRARRRALTWP